MEELFARFPAEAVRLAIMTAHYGAPLDLTDELILHAKSLLDDWYRCLDAVGGVPPARPPQPIVEALLDDLDAPRAIRLLSGFAEAAGRAATEGERRRIVSDLKAGAGLLGVLKLDPADWFAWTPQPAG